LFVKSLKQFEAPVKEEITGFYNLQLV